MGEHSPSAICRKGLPRGPSGQAQAWPPQVCSLGPSLKKLYKEAGLAGNMRKALCSPLHLLRGRARLPCRHRPQARHCKPRSCWSSLDCLGSCCHSWTGLSSALNPTAPGAEGHLRPEAGRITQNLKPWCSVTQADLWEWRGGGSLSWGEGTVAQGVDSHWPERSLHLLVSEGMRDGSGQCEQGGGRFEDPEFHRTLGSLEASRWLL